VEIQAGPVTAAIAMVIATVLGSGLLLSWEYRSSVRDNHRKSIAIRGRGNSVVQGDTHSVLDALVAHGVAANEAQNLLSLYRRRWIRRMWSLVALVVALSLYIAVISIAPSSAEADPPPTAPVGTTPRAQLTPVQLAGFFSDASCSSPASNVDLITDARYELTGCRMDREGLTVEIYVTEGASYRDRYFRQPDSLLAMGDHSIQLQSPALPWQRDGHHGTYFVYRQTDKTFDARKVWLAEDGSAVALIVSVPARKATWDQVTGVAEDAGFELEH
jgi:hypothetical protein